MSQRTGEPGEAEQAEQIEKTVQTEQADTTVRTGYRPEGIDDAFSAGDGPGETARPRVAALLDVDTLGPGHRVDDLACLVGHLAVLPALAPAVYGGVGGLVERCLAVFGTAVDPVGLRARAAGVVLSLVPGAGSRELAEAWLAVADGLLPLPESTLMTTSSASHA